MNLDLLLLVVFGIILLLVMLINRKRVKVEKLLFPIFYLVMYRTNIGLKFMDKTAKKFPRILKILGFIGVVIGFAGMAFIFFNLFYLALGIISKPATATPSVSLLLPGVEIPGLPKLGFFHWIIAIFVLATVHEFSHGIIARLYNIDIKSSGFAVFGILLPILPAAFVEPDESQAEKKTKKAQLSMLAAGSFSNFITAAIFFLILILVMNPIMASVVETKGVKIAGLEEDYPAEISGLEAGESIIAINNIQVRNVEEFVKILNKVKPGNTVLIETDKAEYNIVTATDKNNPAKPYLGVSLQPTEKVYKKSIVEKYGSLFPKVVFWIGLLVHWIFLINLFVGLINLFPLFITDGSRMAYLAVLFFLKDKERSRKVWGFINIFCIFLIFINTSLFIAMIKYLNF